MIPTHLTERLQVFADARFRFDDKPHEYYLGERQLTSFSRWMEPYVNPFVEAEAAPSYARKHNLTVAEVLALWEHNRWVGTATHTAIERFLGGIPPFPLDGEAPHADVAERFEKFIVAYYKWLHEIQPIGLELQAWCEPLGICGTIDFAGVHEKRDGVLIIDWKTNGTFSTNEQCYRKYMRGPFADLLDNHENKYSCQNSFYRILLEEAGIPTAAGAMVHLPPGDAPAKIYKAIDYRDRIRAIL